MNGIPSNETVFIKRTTESGNVFYITAKPTRELYYIYRLENSKAVRLGKGPDPSELEGKFIKEK